MRGSDDRNARFDRRINCIEVSPAIRSEFSLGAEFKNYAVLCSNRHWLFDSARENKALRPQDHLKRDATANLLISHRNCGVWWRLLHNTAEVRDVGHNSRSPWSDNARRLSSRRVEETNEI